MKKQNLVLSLKMAAGVTLTAALLTVSAFAAGFTKTNTYTEGLFTDVPSTEWYATEVANAYELGLVAGAGEGLYQPDGNVTVAEAITMAARAAAIYAGETIDTSASGEWYTPYVNYAVSKGFVAEGQFDNYDRPAKRYELALIFEGAMPDGYFTAKNDVAEIPDVDESLPYQAQLMTLYKAGVVMGSDSYGNFRPEDNITRAEAAAIINRVALPENRLSKTLDVVANDDAYTLVYNTSYTGNKEGINSGWVLDNRGGVPRTSIEGGYGSLADISETEGTAMIREFNKITTGVITLENTVSLTAGFDGFSLEYRNDKDELVYQLITIDGAWKLLGPDGSYTTLMENAKELTGFTFNISVDLDNNRSTTIINKQNYGTYPLATTGEDTNLLNFRFATSEESTAVASFGTMKMTANYAVNNDFAWYTDGTLPFDWVGTNAVNNSGMLNITEGSASKYFNPVSGTVIANAEFNLTEGQSISFAMKSGEKTIVNFTSDENNFYANGVKVYDNYLHNFWYRIRLEARTLENKAVIWVNGREVAEVDLADATTSIDNICLSNSSASAVNFDNVSVFEKIYHEDYVPEPVKPAGEEKYTVGINVCSLWRNGTHFGWACISPYDDAEPILGYYDEGVPETADWEIKYMVEHGIDFQAFCWYAENSNSPIKEPRNAAQLHDGYMYAEYSDAMKYCLIWEAANAARPKDMNAWKQYFVPYFMENYFKDPRYMSIDNQLVLIVFGSSNLPSSFGSETGVKEAFDYLEEQVKTLGYDGMIFLANGSSTNSLAAMGFDGSCAYNWGNAGYQVSVNQNNILASAKNTSMYTVPTISVGFNSIPWHGIRYPMMTPEDYETAHTWVRDEYLPEYAEEGTWQENFVMLSTWNEYGEGTYIMPSNGNGGFGYLDALRTVYTDEEPDESLNLVPTAAQKERINHLYPQYRHLLRKTGYYDFSVDEDELETSYTIDYTNSSNISVGNTSTYEFTSEGLEGMVDGDTLITATGFSISAVDNPALRLTLNVPKGTNVEIYFLTSEDKNWNSSKGTHFSTDKDGVATYIVNMSEVSTWKDNITALRVDPGQTAKGEGDPVKNYFLLVSTEFMKKSESVSRNIYINGKKAEMQLYPETAENGEYLIAFDPKIALDYLLNAYYVWDADAKVLTLELNHHEVVYTVGSDKYMLDGAEKDLGYTMYLVDGLPMIPIQQLCEDVGYECVFNEEGEADITTTQKYYYDMMADRTPGQWEFDTPGDTEGWSSPHMRLFTADGYMTAETTVTTNDPIITLSEDVNLIAAKYKTFEIKVRYKYEKEDPGILTMYFTTDTVTAMREATTIKAKMNSTDSGDEWEVYTVDLSTVPDWQGTIKKLRFDPFNAMGKIEIEYMRFVEDENFVYVEPKPGVFEIRNGDAEQGASTFVSNNATITIVDDPENEGNKVYRVASNAGKNWTYFRQDCEFTPGTTYTIEFDVKLAGLGTDLNGTDPELQTSVMCNMRYTDSEYKIDHITGMSQTLSVADGWVHCSFEHTVDANSKDRSSDQFSIYANPVGESSVNYYIDNVVVTPVEE